MQSKCLTQSSQSPRVSWEELRRDIDAAARDLSRDLGAFWRAAGKGLPEHAEDASCLVSTFRPPAESKPERCFRGQVSISASSTGKQKRMRAVCTTDSTHLVLEGGDNYETVLVKLHVCHLVVSVDANAPLSFGLRIGADYLFGEDTLIILSVSNRAARDQWLSVLWDRGVTVEGWDVPNCYQPPNPLRTNFVSRVTWLS